MIRGKRYHVSTRCHSYEAAQEQLARFEANPDAYQPTGDVSERLPMTAEMLTEFSDWLTSRPSPVTQKHANEMTHLLKGWMNDLDGADLRALQLVEIKGHIDKRRTSRQHRIIALKSFCGWLRTEKYLLTRAQDVTMDLPVPQGTPEQWTRRKAVPIEHVRAVLTCLVGAYRDCLLVLARTGMHVTELGRFARLEESEVGPDPSGRHLGALSFRHKKRRPHVVGIDDPEVLEAAKRIRARGTLPRKMNETLKAACLAANVPPFGYGKMRHSVATWAIAGGASVEDAAQHLGHESGTTTSRHYIDAGIPRVKAPALPSLT